MSKGETKNPTKKTFKQGGVTKEEQEPEIIPIFKQKAGGGYEKNKVERKESYDH